MAEQNTIESPQFGRILKETGVHTRDGIKLLWAAMNLEAKFRRTGVNLARDIIAPKVKTDDPGATQNNYNLEGCSVLLLNGAVNRTFTGFRAPSSGQSHVLIVFNIGSATYTFAHASASSDAENRFRNKSLADNTVATDASVIYIYLNSLWRELKLI